MNNKLAIQIGKAAKTARTKLRLTQEDAAERIEISVEFYGRIERGTTLPSAPTLLALCMALDVSADSLLGLRDAGPLVNAPPPPEKNGQLRRLLRRLRAARPRTLRLVNALVAELERAR